MIALCRAPRAMSSPRFGSPRGSLHPVLLQQGEVGSSPDRKWACQICRLWELWESSGCLACPVLSQGEEPQEELMSRGFRPVSFLDVLRVLEYLFLTDWMNMCPVTRLSLCSSCYCFVSWNVYWDQNISAVMLFLTAFTVCLAVSQCDSFDFKSCTLTVFFMIGTISWNCNNICSWDLISQNVTSRLTVILQYDCISKFDFIILTSSLLLAIWLYLLIWLHCAQCHSFISCNCDVLEIATFIFHCLDLYISQCDFLQNLYIYRIL